MALAAAAGRFSALGGHGGFTSRRRFEALERRVRRALCPARHPAGRSTWAALCTPATDAVPNALLGAVAVAWAREWTSGDDEVVGVLDTLFEAVTEGWQDAHGQWLHRLCPLEAVPPACAPARPGSAGSWSSCSSWSSAGSSNPSTQASPAVSLRSVDRTIVGIVADMTARGELPTLRLRGPRVPPVAAQTPVSPPLRSTAVRAELDEAAGALRLVLTGAPRRMPFVLGPGLGAGRPRSASPPRRRFARPRSAPPVLRLVPARRGSGGSTASSGSEPARWPTPPQQQAPRSARRGRPSAGAAAKAKAKPPRRRGRCPPMREGPGVMTVVLPRAPAVEKPAEPQPQPQRPAKRKEKQQQQLRVPVLPAAPPPRRRGPKPSLVRSRRRTAVPELDTWGQPVDEPPAMAEPRARPPVVVRDGMFEYSRPMTSTRPRWMAATRPANWQINRRQLDLHWGSSVIDQRRPRPLPRASTAGAGAGRPRRPLFDSGRPRTVYDDVLAVIRSG